MVPYTECDFTTVYAYATELKRVSGAKSKITEIKTKKLEDSEEDFIDPDEEFNLKKYEVSSKDGYSNLREKPTKDSKIVLKLTNGTVVKYITKSGDWYIFTILIILLKMRKNGELKNIGDLFIKVS